MDILVAGTGKMARNIGLFFLKKGHSVTWLFRDNSRRDDLETRMQKDIRRLARTSPGQQRIHAELRQYEDPQLTSPQVFVESVSESRGAKHEVFTHLAHLISKDVMVLSNSSSILPSEIHPQCIGMHFFYPVELSGIVEVVFSDGCPRSMQHKAVELAEACGLKVITQTEQTAFAVNRLLLPIQSECLRALMEGIPGPVVDRASTSCMLPVGQLLLLDSIGIDTVLASARNYLRRMDGDTATDYEALTRGLSELLEQGKRGQSNGNGLLLGDPLPWGDGKHAPEDLNETFMYLFVNSCLSSVETGEMANAHLDLVLKDIFGSECSLDDVVRNETRSRICSTLERHLERTQRMYFTPTAALRT
jgi:3-hydroxybutyryl-CoA dehydrogenase